MSRRTTKRVIMLNIDETFLCFITYKKAFNKIAKGEAIALRETAMKVWNGVGRPLIIKLIKAARKFHGNKVKWHRKNVLIRDRNTCQYCGTKEGKMTCDHVHPKSKGGKDTWENTVCACKECNNKKGDMLCHEIKMYLKKRPVRPTIMEFNLIKAKIMNVYELMAEYGYGY